MKWWLCLVVLLLPALTSGSPADPVAEADALLLSHRYSGVVRVSRGSVVLFERAYGLASIEYQAPVRVDTRFGIASISKLYTAVLVEQLASQGRLEYDAPISRYLPDYRGEGGPVVTIRQLLSHTSGIANSDTVGSFEQAVTEGLPMYQLPATPRQLTDRYASGKLVHPPGATFDYNNADYLILGRIVEAVTGLSYPEVLQRQLLVPLGLHDTGMRDWRTVAPPVATAYLCFAADAPCIHELPVYHQNWDAAGGLYATAADVARFSDALFSGQVLPPDRLEHLLTVERDEYAEGLWVAPVNVQGRVDRVAHRPGQVMGANTQLLRYVNDGLTVVMLSNTTSTPMDETSFAIARMFSY